MSQRWRAVGNTVSDLTVRDLNLRPPAPETNAFPLDQLILYYRAVVSRDLSRSRDTIFQSLGLEGLKPRSRLGLGASKSRKMGKSRPYFQSERKNPQ